MTAQRPTVKDALAEIGAHERECAIRYENIEEASGVWDLRGSTESNT